MFGPLPLLHRIILIVIALGTCMAAGIWLAWWTPVHLLVSAGAAIGALVGVAVAWLLTHDLSHHGSPSIRKH